MLGGNPTFLAKNEVKGTDKDYREVLEKYEFQCPRKQRQCVQDDRGKDQVYQTLQWIK